MKPAIILPIYAATSSIAILAMMPSAASAQTIEVVTVTAQKREQSVQDVGLTVTAIGADQLKDASARDAVDIAAFSPNTQVNYGLGNTFFNIRGLGLNEFTANLDAPVAVHVDEVYLSKGFMNGLVLFDVQRTEVLKGPQGDLFGRNTTGGTVNFVTNRPEQEFSAGANFSYGNFNTVFADGYITGGLTENLSARVAGYFTDQGDGFFDNQLTGETEGRVNEFALRGQLLWEKDRTSVLLSFHYGEDSSERNPYEGVGNSARDGSLCPEYLDGTVEGDTPGCERALDLAFVLPTVSDPINGDLPGQFQPGESDPFITQNNQRHDVSNESVGGFLRIEQEFGEHLFTSITAFENFDRQEQEDSDGSPVQSIEVYWNNNINQFTQEFRLQSNFDHDDWNYLLGFFYENDDYENQDYLTAFLPILPNPGNPLNNYSLYTQETNAYAGFLHVEANLTEDLRLIAGARYTNESVEVIGGTFAADGLVEDANGNFVPEVVGAQIASTALTDGGSSRNDDNLSFRLGAEWYPTDDVLVYGNLSTGFRSGGYSVAFASAQDQLVNLDPETITNYEVGFKANLFDGRGIVNGAFFYYEVENGQIDVDVPGTAVPITVNAPQSTAIGFALDSRFAVTSEIEILLGAGYTDSEIGSVAGITIGDFEVEDLGGNRRAFQPNWTFNGQVKYDKEISDSTRFILSADWSWRSDQFLEVQNAPSNEIDGYWLVNSRAALEFADGKYSIGVWVRNLTDTEYVTYLNDLPAFGWLLRGYGPPRTYGASVSVNF